MPRAKRHFLPGYAWHITHRCHKKEFLLKFAKERGAWMSWLYEAKKRYGLRILTTIQPHRTTSICSCLTAGSAKSFPGQCNL